MAKRTAEEQIADIDKKMAQLKAQKNNIKNRAKAEERKKRNHALIVFGSQFISNEQLSEWYQLDTKEIDQKIIDYANQIKQKAGL